MRFNQYSLCLVGKAQNWFERGDLFFQVTDGVSGTGAQ